MSDEIIDRPEASRFELMRGDQVLGYSEYERRDGVLVFTHTVIEPAIQERGLGSKLAAGALDQVRSSGSTIVVECPFIAHFIETHDEYQDLLAD